MSKSQPGAKSNSNRWARPALYTALIYFIVGLVWILLSDRLLIAVTRDPELVTRLQTFKGFFYVAFTSLLLYFLVRANINAHHQVESTLRQRNYELDLANRLGHKLNSTLAFEEVVTVVLWEIRQLLNVTSCSVWLVDPGAQELVCQKVANSEDVSIQDWRLLPGQGITGWAVSHGESVIVADSLADERHFSGIDQMTGIKTRSILVVPLIVQKIVIGAIVAVHTTKEYFKPSDLVIVELLATSATLAIDNATLYSESLSYSFELEERVAKRTRELSEANERLQELDGLKSKFVSDVSHELRTPITNLIMYLDLLERGSPDKIERYLGVLKNQARRLADLVENILTLSRLDIARDKSTEFEAVDLDELVEQLAVNHIPRAEASGLHLAYKLSVELPLIYGVRSQLAQVVTNLLANAIKYTNSGYVHVSTFYDPDTEQVCLEINDSGIGIPAGDLKHIFSRFYRGRNVSQTNISGTGLGLAIAKEIVEQHGGLIEAQSVVGEGSTFRVWLHVNR